MYVLTRVLTNQVELYYPSIHTIRICIHTLCHTLTIQTYKHNALGHIKFRCSFNQRFQIPAEVEMVDRFQQVVPSVCHDGGSAAIATHPILVNPVPYVHRVLPPSHLTLQSGEVHILTVVLVCLWIDTGFPPKGVPGHSPLYSLFCDNKFC